MEQKFYQVIIKVVIEDDCEIYYKTFLFPDKEEAKSCVNTLYEKRFDNIKGFYSYCKNPYNGCDEQSCINEDKIIEDGMVINFKLYEDFSYTSLAVMIEEVSLDLDSSHWEY